MEKPVNLKSIETMRKEIEEFKDQKEKATAALSNRHLRYFAEHVIDQTNNLISQWEQSIANFESRKASLIEYDIPFQLI